MDARDRADREFSRDRVERPAPPLTANRNTIGREAVDYREGEAFPSFRRSTQAARRRRCSSSALVPYSKER
jgi:hypothetical protein